MGISAIQNIQNAFLGHLRTLHIFDQKTKKLDLCVIDFVLNFQGFARCATGVACKSQNNKKMKKIIEKYVILYIYLNHLKHRISVVPICFPERDFSKLTEAASKSGQVW